MLFLYSNIVQWTNFISCAHLPSSIASNIPFVPLFTLSSLLLVEQVEPGSQTEQPPPSAFLLLSPEDMRGYHFMTISVASRQVFP